MWLFKKQSKVDDFKGYVDSADLEKLQVLLDKKKVGLSYNTFGITPRLGKDRQYPVLYKLVDDDSRDVTDLVDLVNKLSEDYVRKQIYSEIAQDPILRFTKFFDTKEKVLSILLHQFFSVDPIHICIIADKRCYMETLIEITHSLHPKSILYNGERLTPSVSDGKLESPGLFADYDEGLICFPNIQKLADSELKVLQNVIRDNSITKKYKSKIFKLPTRVSILAYSNPNTAVFVGKHNGLFKQQFPIETDILAQFHMVVCVRCNDEGCLAPTSYSETDIEFVQDYMNYAHTIGVSFPKKFDEHIVNWYKLVQKEAKSVLSPVSDQLVICLIRLSCAHARMHLRDEVQLEDLKRAMDLLQDTLNLIEYV